ncbi:MAG TPA: type II secretion system F family protein [Lacipirellulaceae bacterium]|nr:type II secretion system F family protein [Lacipirellulaceae bacterium]
MAIYEYHAEDAQGDLVCGQLTAATEDIARQTLESRGFKVLALIFRSAGNDAGMLGDEDISALVEGIGGAAANRLPIEITLAAMAEETKDRKLASVAQQMSAQLDQGASIEQVIANLRPNLPKNITNLLQAGVDSGDLAGTMERLAHDRLASQRIQRRIQMAMAYPFLVTIILVPLLVFLSVYVIPTFGQMFKEFDLELPPVTQMILQTSQQIPYLVGGFLIVLFVIPISFRLLGGRWLFHRVRSALPVVGPIWTWSGQREFAAQLASFISLRLPMTDAIAFTGDAVSDRNVGWACRRVAQRLEGGQTLADCLGRSIHFDRSLVALVAWGEQHGLLPEALRVATHVFDDQIDQYTSLLKRILPPVTLVAVAAIMFFVIIGLMVPMVKLIEGLSA